MGIPNVLGMRIVSSTPVQNRIKQTIPRVVAIGSPMSRQITKKSKFVEDVNVLTSGYDDKAFIYDSGKVDIKKNNMLKTIRFKNKKDAVLYLMKAGWKFV